MQTSFTLISWHDDFITALRDCLLADTNQRPEQCVVIFPHDRPRRYFIDAFKTYCTQQHTPLILPRICTSTEFMSMLRAAQDSKLTRRTASALDTAAILWQCVQNLARTDYEDTPLCTQLAEMDQADFIPWGMRLAEVLEECFTHGVTPADLHHAEGDVAPFAAALLSTLGRLFHAYKAALDHRELTTPGLDAFMAATYVSQHPNAPLPPPFTTSTLYFAGFHLLSGTENTLFFHLWQRGASFCLHGDPALASPSTPCHDACALQAEWLTRWGAICTLISKNHPQHGHVTPHFFAGYDLHSQLEALQHDLADLESSLQQSTTSTTHRGSVAVVLPQAGALLPVLHQLPDKNCNVSLGYPLERSLLGRLFDAILNARDSARNDEKFHWRALLHILRHPYLRMLRDEGHGSELRQPLHVMENQLRCGAPYVLITELLEQTLHVLNAHTNAAPEALLQTTLFRLTHDWLQVQAPADMADCLWSVGQHLLTHGGDIWKRFPLDAESLFRVMQRLVPTLRENELANQQLPWPLLRSLFTSLFNAERVPFEADPITGVQVLGMLETRLLRFKHVFVLDATDDVLPGSADRNPLLPDTMRSLVGLPDTTRREQVMSHTFYRLLAGADTIHLYWQEGTEGSGLFDAKKQRSRFVEFLLWREEQRAGRIFAHGEYPLRTPQLSLRPPTPARRVLNRTPALNALMQRTLSRPISPTTLDAYIRCPLCFCYERLFKLKPLEEVLEEDDVSTVGTLIHDVLQSFYTPWIGKHVTPEDLSAQTLCDMFDHALHESGLLRSLPPESAAMLQATGPRRLRAYLKAQPTQTRIIHLEQTLARDLTCHDRTWRLEGKVDRIDERDDECIIIDYKTGRLHEIPDKTWNNEALWNNLTQGSKEGSPLLLDPTHDLLTDLAVHIPSMQLLVYCYIYERASNAAFIKLAAQGTEHPLFAPSFEVDTRQEILTQRIPNVLRYVLLHMATCPAFRPREGRHCDWCSAAKLCML